MNPNTQIDHIIQSRHAVRAFLSTPISEDIIREILTIASKAPSGTNTQPWKVYVVLGEAKARIMQRVCNAQTEIFKNPELKQHYQPHFEYYPSQWFSPYIERRRQNGWTLYNLLNIQKGEKEKMAQQLIRNFKFFDAPVGLFFTVHQNMGIGAKIDTAMFIQNIMLAAKARGLDTCPQAAWNDFHSIIFSEIHALDHEELVCGLALGYADPNAIENTLITPREPVENFASFIYK